MTVGVKVFVGVSVGVKVCADVTEAVAVGGVWFNVAVDIGVLALFPIPLITSLRK